MNSSFLRMCAYCARNKVFAFQIYGKARRRSECWKCISLLLAPRKWIERNIWCNFKMATQTGDIYLWFLSRSGYFRLSTADIISLFLVSCATGSLSMCSCCDCARHSLALYIHCTLWICPHNFNFGWIVPNKRLLTPISCIRLFSASFPPLCRSTVLFQKQFYLAHFSAPR